MPIEIVEVDLAEMHRTALLNRAKSPQVRAIYEAMFSLQAGEAMAVIPEPDEELSQIRNLVTQCAARANLDMQVVVDRVAGRVLFTQKPPQAGQKETPVQAKSARSLEEQAALAQRRERIREAALALGRERPQISAQEVVDFLRDSGDAINTARPTTAASAVMRNMPEFEHVDRSRFTYRG